MIRGIEAIAVASEERARDRRAVAGRLLAELQPFQGAIATALLLVLIVSSMTALSPWIISHAIDDHILKGDRAGLTRMMIALFFTYLVGFLAQRRQSLQIGSIGQKVLARLRVKLFDHFQRLPLGYFDRTSAGDLMSRVTNDVDTLNQLLTMGLTQLMGSIFGLMGVIIAMLVMNPRLALASFVIIPIMLICTRLFAVRARKAFRQTRQTTGDVNANIQEQIVGVREAQAFNRTEANIRSFRERNAANRNANVQAVSITSAFSPFIDVLGTLATAIVMGYGGYLAFHGQLTVGGLAAFLIYTQMFFRPIQLISQVYAQMQSSLAGAERIYAILDEPAEPGDPAAAQLETVRGEIAFRNVSFAYHGHRKALEDVSFTIAPGQTVALVGPTGAGKTTITNLIVRFYDVSGGSITLDGRDLRILSRAGLREQIAMVLQEPYLFSGTIAENLAYGKLDATQDQIEAAAKAVEAHGFIAALPQGYRTVLGEGGGQLSQGQRQLLSFARAILADRPILILDEATSHVDTRTEETIQRALDTLMKDRTSIVIAHRLSTIRRADCILVVEGGRIVEQGNHEALMAQGGRYADLFRRQFREKTPKSAP